MTDEIRSPSAVMAQTGGTVKQAQSIAQPTGRHRLQLRCPDLDSAHLEYALYSRPPIRRMVAITGEVAT